MSAFENQLTTSEDRLVFSHVELKTRMNKTKEDIAKSFDYVLKQRPEAASMPWFTSLRDAVIDFVTDEENASVACYIDSIEYKYTGRVILMLNEDVEGLFAFTESELSAPHMQWLKVLDRKYHEYRDLFTEIDSGACFAMARYSTLHNLTSEKLKELYKAFTDPKGRWFIGLTFKQWADWYHKSEEMFDESGYPLAEQAEKMFKTLTVWKDQDFDENVRWLCRNYEIHPFHKPNISKWIAESRKTIAEAQ
ncbi:conserved hypothetical protein [Vibrio chagasii]|nr:conserved hypothetical protein [Vibrio chagasii]CAH7222893.1 conserved hypothetical protein [Vibrio chagasii]